MNRVPLSGKARTILCIKINIETFISMSKESVERFWVLSAAALSVFVLYAPQPLLPLFGSLYGVNEPSAGLIMTATMLPLAIAPLSYGYLLGHVKALVLLRISIILLALLTGLTGLVQNYSQLLVIRFLQGMVIPASLTAVMAYLAQPGRNSRDLQQSMSLYVTATISGGFLGRFLAGVSSAFINWQTFFYLLAVLLALCFYKVGPQKISNTPASKPASFEGKRATLQALHSCLPVYLAIFLLFSVFCGTLNYLPFRIIDLAGSRSEVLAGLMYCGYITGIMTSMGAGRLISIIGSRSRVMIGGYLLFVVTLLAMLIPDTVTMFIMLFPFCGTMFLVHSVATAVVNSTVEGTRGVASALYVSSYYCGGVVGSYLPGFIYKGQGWGAMILVLAGLGLLGAALLVVFFRRPGTQGIGEK